MKKKFLAFVLLIVIFLVGCTQNNNNSSAITMSSSSNNINQKNSSSGSSLVSSSEIDDVTLNLLVDFVANIKKMDIQKITQAISKDGLVVIRNFNSGFGTRGKDIRNIYLKNEIPNDLKFTVPDETSVDVNALFNNLLKDNGFPTDSFFINDLNIGIKDNIDNKVFEPSTDEIREKLKLMYSKGSKIDAPQLYNLSNKEYVLCDQAQIIDNEIFGSFMIFEKNGNEIFLRSIIDLQ